MIEVSFDRERKLVRVVMSGSHTVEDVARFSHDRDEAVRAMGLNSREFVLLVVTSNVVQRQEVVAALQHMTGNSRLKAKRIATVRAGALHTMQIRRILSARSETAIFETVEEAEAWLFN